MSTTTSTIGNRKVALTTAVAKADHDALSAGKSPTAVAQRSDPGDAIGVADIQLGQVLGSDQEIGFRVRH